jgi:hypothetical protein
MVNETPGSEMTPAANDQPSAAHAAAGPAEAPTAVQLDAPPRSQQPANDVRTAQTCERKLRKLKADNARQAAEIDKHAIAAERARKQRDAAQSQLLATEAQIAEQNRRVSATRRELREERLNSKDLARRLTRLGAEFRRLERASWLERMFAARAAQSWVRARRRPAAMSLGDGVAFAGDGPHGSDGLSALVARFGIRAQHLKTLGDPTVEVLVIGREEFQIDELEYQLRARSAGQLRIYSQEMFVAALILNDDPFKSAGAPILKSFAQGHPSLEALLRYGFEWPSQNVKRLGEAMMGLESDIEESPPHRMGYVVGVTNGLPTADRRRILRDAFSGPLPKVSNSRYMASWGSPESAVRLRRMARHIAWLVKTRRGLPNLATARREWSTDLSWLKAEFYEPWMRFRWPAVYVGDGGFI